MKKELLLLLMVSKDFSKLDINLSILKKELVYLLQSLINNSSKPEPQSFPAKKLSNLTLSLKLENLKITPL
jgi:hypothetical protein